MAVDLSALKRRRGAIKASITKLTAKIAELESKEPGPTTLSLAQQFTRRVEKLDDDFKTRHFAIIDVLEDEGQLAEEQDALDTHDEELSELNLRLQAIMDAAHAATVPPSPTPTPASEVHPLPSRAVLERRSAQLQARLASTHDKIGDLKDDGSELHLIHLHQEHLGDLKREISDLRNAILEITADISDPLLSNTQKQEDNVFSMLATVKKLLFPSPPPDPTSPTGPPGSGTVKLPKIDVPTFDGELLHWQTFWEQFSVSVDKRSDISNTEKLVYLRHSLKDGSAKNVIEGLSHSGDQYSEAIDSLKARYDRPRIIHQAHVRRIYEVPSLKDGSGKEIRRFHDTVKQHLRALKAMREDPTGSFITALLELKLDKETVFEWQKASQASKTTPHYNDLLDFLDLRAQASETCSNELRKVQPPRKSTPRSAMAFSANAQETTLSNCSLCKTTKHPLYACPRFKLLPHDQMLSTIRTSNICMNCLKPGHFARNCSSNNRCRRCQKPHHTLLHSETKQATEQSSERTTPSTPTVAPSTLAVAPTVPTCAQSGSGSALLMTCQMLVHSPDGSCFRARGLLDSGSSASFISERLAQSLRLPLSTQQVRITGITGMSRNSPLQSIASFAISPTLSSTEKLQVSAIVVPRVTCDLPTQPVHLSTQWGHLKDLHLADPDFGQPCKIDVLLGVDVYADVLLHGRRSGPPGTPVAFETKFGWVLAGRTNHGTPSSAASHHAATISGDDLLRKFWEIEECPGATPSYSPEERAVVRHFAENHRRSQDGRFVVPLPRNTQAKQLGESRSSAVRRFLSLERSLRSKGQFVEFATVMNEYVDLNHAEPVPTVDLKKPPHETFYLPMHAVRKEESTTTKLRVVFDASAKSSTGVSLNDSLLVGPTVHPPLLDVLLRFRTHRVALTTDVSKMYRAVELVPADRDLHRFVWRNDPQDVLLDYRMTRVTFGVSASSFAANMAVKQNALDHALEFPLAAKCVDTSFYVDDGLTGADSVEEAVELQRQLQHLFTKGGFLLRKWNSSDPQAIQHLSEDLKDTKLTHDLPMTETYTKTLGIQWNAQDDYFKISVPSPAPLETLTKRGLVSDVAKTFDVMGWFSPSTIKAKILMQQLWEHKVDWDDPVPEAIHSAWLQWRTELHLLSQKIIPRCFFLKDSDSLSFEIHGFSDASELAYAAVVYLRITDSSNHTHISMIMSKSKVAPIKRLTIPRLELCGAQLLARLIHHVRQVLDIPLSKVYAWTDSTIVLNWLDGSPRRFKTYVGNRISTIVDLVPPDKWRHVRSADNPADCASRGLYPSELLEYSLWWNGPDWLDKSPSEWPEQLPLQPNQVEVDSPEVSLHTATRTVIPIVPIGRFSSFNHLKRVTAWMLRFIGNCQIKDPLMRNSCPLVATELQAAENYWIKLIQSAHFEEDLTSLRTKQSLSKSSSLLHLQPFLDDSGILRVGGRRQLSQTSGYRSRHPAILHGRHPLTHVLVRDEHLRLLHAGPTLLTSSLSRRFHLVGGRKLIRSITRECVTCRKYTARPKPQLLGQLPVERITPGSVFDKVGVDYAGPMLIKYGHVRKPTIVKAYVCVFVSLAVKAVHLELVSDLTSEAFIACLKRFISRRGLPTLIWSDNGTNFVGASREIKEIYEFLRRSSTQDAISHYLTDKGITWKFIPQHAPHFGGIWEAAVKSMKTHLKRIMGDVKLTYEEFSTILCQIEACLNSRPLIPMPNDDDGIEALTPGHFLIGRPLTAVPDMAPSQSLSLLRRWQLCKSLVRHFWKRWSTEYVTQLGRFNKWCQPTRNLQPGDLVIIREDSPIVMRWPLARVLKVHPGRDNLVRVALVKTSTGVYTRPVNKLAVVLPNDDQPQ